MVGPIQIEEWQGPAEELIRRIVATPCCRALLKIWQDARTDPRQPPRKSDLDPVLLAKAGLMPNLWVVERGVDDYFYRLMGEDIRGMFTTPIRGRRMHELFQEPLLSFIRQRHDRLVFDKRVEYCTGLVYHGDEPSYYGHRLMVPLVDDHAETNVLFGTVDRLDRQRRAETTENPRYTYDFIGSAPVAEL